jgi:hypothetical protein
MLINKLSPFQRLIFVTTFKDKSEDNVLGTKFSANSGILLNGWNLRCEIRYLWDNSWIDNSIVTYNFFLQNSKNIKITLYNMWA